MGKKCDIRQWTKKNKIFIDWFTTISLGIMSILVSVNSCKLTERQIKNDELLNMPLIQVKSESFDLDEKNDSEWIYITNVGNYASDYSTSKYVFLRCMYYPDKGNPIELYLPISNMLDSSFPSHEYIGKVETYLTAKTNKYYHDLQREAIEVENGYLFLDIKKYISVSYNDFRGRKHNDLFSVITGYTGVKIDLNKELEELIRNNYYYRISELSIEQIMDLLKTQGKEIKR